MRPFGRFALVTAVVVAGLAWGVGALLRDPAAVRSVWVSAGVAVAVQLAAFGLTLATRPANVVAGWGAGMIFRILALAVYGLLVVKALGLVMEPALLSLAGFFFVTTLLEPVFLKP
ncbi:MAG: hypothetical protein ACHQQ3_04660 [Gemmatimonadales bacterium]